MKCALIILCAIIACGYAATVPHYVPIATHEESLRAASPVQSRIAGGFAALQGQFPHQASMLAPTGGNFYLCGGSIISPAWMLTAAHCTIAHDQFNLRFGNINLFLGGVAQTSFHSIMHPMFNPITLNNDVSLISIPTPLTLTPAIQPIRLPTLTQIETSFVNIQTQVSGWGETGAGAGVESLLRWVYLRPISNAACTTVFGAVVVADHVICAEGYTSPANQGTCGGDSGGALTYLEADGIRTQIGFVAFGAAAGCDAGYPSGFMRTSHFVNWIASHTSIPVRP